MNNKLRALRLEKGLTQKQLALQLNSTDKNIWAYEKGNVSPPPEILIAYANYFEVSTDYLLGLEDDFDARVPAPMGESAPYSSEERELIKKYRELNAPGKKLVKTVIDTQLATMAESGQNKNKIS